MGHMIIVEGFRGRREGISVLTNFFFGGGEAME